MAIREYIEDGNMGTRLYVYRPLGLILVSKTYEPRLFPRGMLRFNATPLSPSRTSFHADIDGSCCIHWPEQLAIINLLTRDKPDQGGCMKFLMTLLLTVCAIELASAQPYVRQPAPSPDGTRIAFSYRGDIWTVTPDGTDPTRLTVHPAYDAYPVWSPDGKWIAFSSKRHGNMDVFVIPAAGGKARRLTWHSADDVVSDFNRNSDEVLFYARYRGDHYYRDPILYTVPVAGGTPKPLFQDFGNMARFAPDGHRVAYVDHNPPWWRKDYRGPANMDIRVFDGRTGTFSDKLTTFDGNDYCPMWLDDSVLYYLSDTDGFMNVWKMSADGSGKEQITRVEEQNMAYAAIARDGSLIAIELNGKLLILATATGELKEITVTAPSDITYADMDILTENRGASDMIASPDGKQIAFVVYGDVFVMKTEKGKARNLTQDNFRQQDLAWSPDGKYLYFASDRSGNYDIFRVSSATNDPLYRTLELKTEQITRNPEDDMAPDLSPDGKQLAFMRGTGDIILADGDGRNQRIFLEHWYPSDFSWSPDSRFIAYAMTDNMFNTDIYIRPVGEGNAVNITRHPDDDYSPEWTADGKMLYFLSHRDGYSNDVWYVYLTKADDQMTEEEREEARESAKNMKKDKKKAKKAREEGEDENEDEPGISVAIDFDNIHKRIHKLTRLEGDEGSFAVSEDGEEIVFTARIKDQSSLWKIKRTGEDLEELKGTTGVASIHYNKEAKVYFFRTGTGGLKSVTFKGKLENYGYNAKVVTSTAAIRRQMFLECWRIMNNRFYDPDFHGEDWEAMKEKYMPLADQAASREDFDDVIRQMIGELNGSHLGIYPPSRGVRFQTGSLGILTDYDHQENGWKVRRVLDGSPASYEKSRIYAGDVITAINGAPVGGNTSVYANLFDTVGERILLRVTGKDGKERKVTIEPVSPRETLNSLYDDWVEQNRKLVTEYSGGRLGYVHIRSMDQTSYNQFQQEVYSEARDKDGLVIDVRNNGGGWTTDILLRIIGQKQHAFTIPRDGGKGYPDMERKQVFLWTHPIVVTCNEGSYSNAEIFSHAVKTLGLGKLVGMPTFGAVISTGGTRLIDGSYFRIPFRGWYVAGTGQNMENGPAVPDYIVETQPEDEARGMDRQLKKAVQVLLQQLNN